MRKIILSVVTSLTLAVSLNAGTVYATVNNDEITKEDITLALRNPQIKFDELPKDTKDKILNQIIDQKLLSQKAVKTDVVNSKEYKTALSKIKQDLALQLWMKREISKVKVSDKEAKAFYNKNKNSFKSEEKLTARHILVKELKDAKAIIKDLDKAKNKKEKFIELAKAKSEGPTGAKGGFLGEFSPKQMVPEFSAAASSLKKNTYTKTAVKTQFGYHVIYLEDKKSAAAKKFDEVKSQITQTLMQQEITKFIKTNSAELRKKAKIVIK